MPGVPSSKACNACRKVKKKCDQLHPRCSRCQRLDLPCEGSGQQRYLFKNATAQSSNPNEAAVSRKVIKREKQCPISVQMPVNPLTLALVSTLQIRDIRYDLSYYGPFFRDIPQLLGHSSALDAATMALMASYPFFRGKDIPPDALISHGRSLRVLRETLSDPKEARSPHTMCAIYLISVCTSWLGSCDYQSVGHGGALAYLLKNTDLEKFHGKFEKDMITTLTVVVIFESIGNPNVHLGPKALEKLVKFVQPPTASSYSPLGVMSRLPDYLRSPQSHLTDMGIAYSKLGEIARKLRAYIEEMPITDSKSFSSPAVLEKARTQAGYVFTLATLLVINALLRVFDPSNSELLKDTTFYCGEIMYQAVAASCYRPLGAAYSAVCLAVALATTEDPEQAAQIELVLDDYEADFEHAGWKARAKALKNMLNYYRDRVKPGAVNEAQNYHADACGMM